MLKKSANTKEFLPSRFKGLELKDDGDFGRFRGYAITWDNVDRVKDVAVKGCFARTLKENPRVIMNWQHDYHSPIGSFTSMTEDDKGLLVEGRINLGTTNGKEAYALLKAGDIDGLSIGYNIHGEDGCYVKDGIRYLTDLDLFEVSVVSVPCNPEAQIDSVKSMGAPTAKEIAAEMRKMDKQDAKTALLKKKRELLAKQKAMFECLAEGKEYDEGQPSPSDKGKKALDIRQLKSYSPRELETALRDTGLFSNKAAATVASAITKLVA